MLRIRASSLALVVTLAGVAAVLTVVPTPPPAAADTTVDCTPTQATAGATGEPADGIHPIRPVRLADTRSGLGGHQGRLDRNCVLRIDLDDTGAIGARATAVALSVIAVDADTRGFQTVYPCDGGRPPTSNVNPRPGIPTPNLVITPVQASRDICVFTNVPTHLVVDATGWYGPDGDAFTPIEPTRALDTRSGPRYDLTTGPVPARTPYRVPLAPTVVPSGATAVAVNVTASQPTDDGWLLAYPCDDTLPLASTVNYVGGEDRAGMAMVGLDDEGGLCVYSLRETEVILDVVGWYGADTASQMQPLVGQRVVDSRNGTGGWNGKLGAGEVRSFDPIALGAVPAATHTAVLNVVATEAERPGHLRVFPCSPTLPPTSAVNFNSTDEEATNLVVAPLADDRTVCVYASAPTHVVIDAFGAFSGGVVQQLTVSPQALFPEFREQATDYGVRCGSAGANTIEFDWETVPGTTVTLDGAAAPADGSRSVTADADDLVTFSVTQAGRSTDYHFRCLPPDYPIYTIDRPGEPGPGYYLVTMGLNDGAPGDFAAVLDTNLVPVWYKRTDEPVIDMHRIDESTVAWTELLGTGFGVDPTRGYEVHDLDGSLVDVWRTVDELGLTVPTDHHELLVLPNGNRIMVSYPVREGLDLRNVFDSRALGGGDNWVNLDGSTGGVFGPSQRVVDALIQEIRPNGSIAWSWYSPDHIDLDETTVPLRFTNYGPAGEIDLIHVNSIEVLPSGDLLVSARHLDAVFRIDRDANDDGIGEGNGTGAVVWKLGGFNGATQLAVAGDPLTVPGTGVRGPARMHDARAWPDGTISMLDNRSYTGQPTRIARYRVAGSTATLVEEIREPLGRTSGGLGSARRLDGGSWVVTWGSTIYPMLEEITSDGERLLAMITPPAGQMYRVVKVGPDAFVLDTLRATAGGPAESP